MSTDGLNADSTSSRIRPWPWQRSSPADRSRQCIRSAHTYAYPVRLLDVLGSCRGSLLNVEAKCKDFVNRRGKGGSTPQTSRIPAISFQVPGLRCGPMTTVESQAPATHERPYATRAADPTAQGAGEHARSQAPRHVALVGRVCRPCAVVGVIGYESGRSSLRASAFDRMTEIRESQSRLLQGRDRRSEELVGGLFARDDGNGSGRRLHRRFR